MSCSSTAVTTFFSASALRSPGSRNRFVCGDVANLIEPLYDLMADQMRALSCGDKKTTPSCPRSAPAKLSTRGCEAIWGVDAHPHNSFHSRWIGPVTDRMLVARQTCDPDLFLVHRGHDDLRRHHFVSELTSSRCIERFHFLDLGCRMLSQPTGSDSFSLRFTYRSPSGRCPHKRFMRDEAHGHAASYV
jgi:hypothetical protein